jgi:hypothetical protein
MKLRNTGQMAFRSPFSNLHVRRSSHKPSHPAFVRQNRSMHYYFRDALKLVNFTNSIVSSAKTLKVAIGFY